jgi:hypothetical protein
VRGVVSLDLEGGPTERDVEVHARRPVTHQQHQVLLGTFHGGVDARLDALRGQRGDHGLHACRVTLDDRIDVRRHAAHSMRDDRDSSDDHPRSATRIQRSTERGECVLQLPFTATGFLAHEAR